MSMKIQVLEVLRTSRDVQMTTGYTQFHIAPNRAKTLGKKGLIFPKMWSFVDVQDLEQASMANTFLHGKRRCKFSRQDVSFQVLDRLVSTAGGRGVTPLTSVEYISLSLNMSTASCIE
ncbi:hypothetical protein K443DRAFT_593664 [Laccaria amethystina LaAM-08-1]|uniref:Unplaced genomic scaffold K443scaffold_82, whole genome shotgun sequence n=1 Tax=Laccaria amethystina LaAM-08-1 TaxID=1095629 RepID=A0A0C9XYF2_9AGAR|nr:hypothetical protein K443DRAFT_593664 [Laccaria amethystina LaAM-08-1]